MENEHRQPENDAAQADERMGDSYGFYARPSRRGLYTVIAVIVLMTVAAVFARGQWLRIHRAEVIGLVNKTRQEVLALAQISDKSTYFNLNEKKIEVLINSDRYLEFVAMEKVWPDGVILTVNERVPVANFLYRGVQYVISADGMVLESTTNIALDNGCVKVTGLDVRDIRVGSKIICRMELQMEAMQQILAELRIQDVLSKTAELNLTALENIYLVTLDGYTVNIGNADELRAKIGTVRAVVQELRRRGLSGGMIEATVPGQASYRPIQ